MSFEPSELASGRRIVVLTLLVGVLVAGFAWRNAEITRLADGQQVVPLDGRFTGYTPDDAATLFDALGKQGRKLYAISELSLDLLFPAVYGALLAMLMLRLWRRPWLTLFMAVTLLTVLADLIENGLIAYLACTYSNGAQPLVHAASLATVTKWSLVAVVLAGVAIGVIRAGVAALRAR